MTAPASTKGLFARQVAAAAAQRGRLAPLYQALSDHYTLMLQRMYPVWVLIGPGLADPGHIEVHSRTIWLDSDELLGPRAVIAAGRLQSWRILVSLGVAIHEVFHAIHTKPWVLERDIELGGDDDPALRQLAADRRLLEEPRMEAHGVRGFPAATARGRFVRAAVRAAVSDVIAPRLITQIAASTVAGQPATRDLCATSMTYLHARTHCETVDPAVLGALQAIWEQGLGAADVQALDDLYARLVWAADGDDDALDAFAREYRAIIGPPDAPPPSAAAAGGAATDGDGAGDAGDGSAETAPTPGSLTDAMRQAAAAGRDGALEQLDLDISLQELLQQTAGQRPPPDGGGRGVGTGMPTGRLPDRGVNRPPAPDEIQQAVQYANRLARARTVGHKQIAKRTPGGRFDARGHIRARAQRLTGAPVTSHSWSTHKQVRTPLLEPHVALIVDTSGSMSAYEYALGPIVWILGSGLQRFGGRMATSLFGNGCELLSDGSRPLAQVPGIRVGGGTAFGGDAIDLACEHLDMENLRRPRFVYVLSDGGWIDTKNGVQRIRRLRELGVPTVHLSIGMLPPLSVDADKVTLLSDPATAMDIVAADTVDALKRPARRPQAI